LLAYALYESRVDCLADGARALLKTALQRCSAAIGAHQRAANQYLGGTKWPIGF
jgi:hypothetical protein